MKIEIKNRFTNAVIFAAEVAADDPAPIRTALKQAIAAGANLAGADLADADLAGANLAGADLAVADLAGAHRAGADLADAYLARANLADADLAGADLADADLAGAYLARANLARADLADADLAGAYLADARNLPAGTTRADPPEPYVRALNSDDVAKRMARYRERHPGVPIVDGLDRKILDAVTAGGGKLDMSQWHTCETTHCRAGWAIALAGAAGKALEDEHGPHRAGTMIYRASTGRVPHFFATDVRALEDIKRCAEVTGEANGQP